jgi:hypothetical protein
MDMQPVRLPVLQSGLRSYWAYANRNNRACEKDAGAGFRQTRMLQSFGKVGVRLRWQRLENARHENLNLPRHVIITVDVALLFCPLPATESLSCPQSIERASVAARPNATVYISTCLDWLAFHWPGALPNNTATSGHGWSVTSFL